IPKRRRRFVFEIVHKWIISALGSLAEFLVEAFRFGGPSERMEAGAALNYIEPHPPQPSSVPVREIARPEPFLGLFDPGLLPRQSPFSSRLGPWPEPVPAG